MKQHSRACLQGAGIILGIALLAGLIMALFSILEAGIMATLMLFALGGALAELVTWAILDFRGVKVNDPSLTPTDILTIKQIVIDYNDTAKREAEIPAIFRPILAESPKHARR